MSDFCYNGVWIPLIEKGNWPNGETLLASHCSSGRCEIVTIKNAIALRNGRAFTDCGDRTGHFCFWAILPEKPAPRRLTNRELGELVRKGYDILTNVNFVWYGCAPAVNRENESKPCTICIKALRAPNSDKWLEPTSDLLEVEK